MSNLDEFTLAYIECALWSSNDESTESGGEPMDANYDIDDIAAETLDLILADCIQFQNNNVIPLTDLDLSRAGHDFWLTRNSHGAGFWDGDYPKDIGAALTKSSKSYGPITLYVGDDNLLYLM